jgi:hypothetical protein
MNTSGVFVEFRKRSLSQNAALQHKWLSTTLPERPPPSGGGALCINGDLAEAAKVVEPHAQGCQSVDEGIGGFGDFERRAFGMPAQGGGDENLQALAADTRGLRAVENQIVCRARTGGSRSRAPPL